MRAGQILGTARKLTVESRYEITLPRGAAGVQPASAEGGTVHVVKSPGTLTVLSGTMLMARVDGDVHTQVVTAGQQLDPDSGVVVELPAKAPERRLWPH